MPVALFETLFCALLIGLSALGKANSTIYFEIWRYLRHLRCSLLHAASFLHNLRTSAAAWLPYLVAALQMKSPSSGLWLLSTDTLVVEHVSSRPDCEFHHDVERFDFEPDGKQVFVLKLQGAVHGTKSRNFYDTNRFLSYSPLMRIVVARRLGLRGEGLGNEIVSWAKGFIASQVLHAHLVGPSWGINKRRYYRNFGTSRLDIVLEEVLTKLPHHAFTERDYHATGEIDFGNALQSWAHERGMTDKSSFIVTVDGMYGGYPAIRRARSFLWEKLLGSRGRADQYLQRQLHA